MKILEILSKKEPSPDSERREYYKKRSEELTEQLNDIRTNYDFVTEPGAIDALIFAENSVTCQLEQLYRSARAEGISIQLHERKK